MVLVLLQKRSTADLIYYVNRFSKQSPKHIVQLSEKYCHKNFSIGALAQQKYFTFFLDNGNQQIMPVANSCLKPMVG